MTASRCVPGLALLAVAACGGVDYSHPPPAPETLGGLQAAEPVAFTPSDDLLPSVSKDGRYVLFVSEQNGNLDVWVRDYQRDSIFPLTKESSADDFDPRISPDGERMVFVTRRLDAKGDIFISDSNSESDIERLTDDTTRDRQPVWSPDARFVYFTTARGIGRESIARVDRDTKAVTKVSPGYGFDPAVDPTGRFLVYTEPPTRDFEHPHLVALRLADGSTVALTKGDAPEGFAAFVPRAHRPAGAADRVLYVRFPDDDNGDGLLDAGDNASVWRIDVDLAARFGRAPVPEPHPLTDGNDDELFPTADDGWLYVTKGTEQQDIVRYPIDGIFPRYANPADYFELAKVVEDLRTRWFVLRLARARAEAGSLLRAQADLRIANIQLDRGRPDLAETAFTALRAETKDARPESPEAELAGIANVELTALAHDRRLESAAEEKRGVVIDRTARRLERLATEYAWSARVVVRIDLEQAELAVDRGERVRAIALLDAIAEREDEPYSASRASLRRIELLEIAHDVAAIGEAYRRVLERFPTQLEIVREAARRIVEVHVQDLGVAGDWRERVDALRRIVPRYGKSPVRVQARWRLARLLESAGVLDAAALEYEQIFLESDTDRSSAARALVALATVDERRGRWDSAAEEWRKLRSDFGDLPGFDARARDAITRVNLVRAAEEEARGDQQAALAAYRQVIDNDVTQIMAHRRAFALAAATGSLDAAIEEAKRRAERSASTPVARYAYGLALTWTDPPDLDEATFEIDEAIRLNPQLAAAYVTRGWIREMRERNPGVFATVTQKLFATVGNMIGGLLDVEIGQSGELELAIGDYKTALRLNAESVDPKLEAEILLNLGNAHYGLAEKTADVSNMRLAFDRYVEMQNLGYTFDSPITEALFWERFGRSAIWAEEPVISAMATRRALEFARRAGLSSRLAQLQGNLSLAYANAGEEAYARAALDDFGAQLEQRRQRERLIIAVRNRARARLGAHEARTAESIDDALGELKTSREILTDEGATPRGSTPDLWRGAVTNHTSAQYGFRPIAELGINLALAEIAHDALGEESRVVALRAQRERITEEVIGSSPAILFGIGDAEPVALLQVRERIGLRAANARRALMASDRAMASEAYLGALAELEGWIEDDRLSADVGGLAVDRGRLVAAMVEADVELKGLPLPMIANAERDIPILLDPARTATGGVQLLTNEVLDRLPPAITSSVALATTASVTLAAPQLAAPLLDARAVLGRLAHAEALVHLRTAHGELGGAPTLGGLLGSLERSSSTMSKARAAFERAAIVAAGAGPGRGGPIVVLALLGLAETLRATGERRLVPQVIDAARDIAKAIGRPDLDTTISLSAVATRSSTAAFELEAKLRERGPHAYDRVRGLYEGLLVRTASAAIAAGRVSDAIQSIDRWLLVRSAGRVVSSFDARAPGDHVATLRYVRLLDRLDVLRTSLVRLDFMPSNDRHAALMSQIAETMTQLADFEELASVDLSELGLARVFAVGQSADVLPFDLSPRQIIVAPVPIDGRLHLAIVDGSTTTASQLAVVATSQDFAKVRATAKRVWSALGSDPSAVAEARRALVEPIADRLVGKTEVVLVSTLLGVPVPQRVFEPERINVAHVRSLSSLGLLMRRQLVGVEGVMVVEGERSVSMVTDGLRLSPDDMLAFRRRADGKSPDLGVSIALDSRSKYERYASRAVRHVVVEAPLSLEPSALARSAIAVKQAPSDEGGVQSARADAFFGEVPLANLDLPATTLVLARVTSTAVGGAVDVSLGAALGLDLELAPKGYATTVVIPEAVPAPAARRVVQSFLERVERAAPARALADAIRAHRNETPSVERITLIGSPGLDTVATKAFAKSQLKRARSYAVDRLKNKKYEEAVPALERWVRLQTEAEEAKYIGSAYLALVGVLGDRLQEHVRAADTMERYVAFLEASDSSERNKADAVADLAYLYSRAQDYEKAEATFERAIERLQRIDEPEGVARAWFKLARHYREKLDFNAAARFMERAIERYESLGEFAKKKGRKKEADLALVQVGDIYLNGLSDPERARRAYERAERYARRESQRIDVTIDLARVARRRGDFDRAAKLAAQARNAAKKKGLATRELSGVVEAANVAWYRGDYQLGEGLCRDSLALTAEMYGAIAKNRGKKKAGIPSKRSVQQLEIYARSVCGLVAMSLRDFDQATQHLIVARRIAERIGRQREVATQFNNLGRVYLEFDRRQDAIDAFRSALAIDQRLDDRYALAYDLRNLGRALTLRGEYAEALEALERGLGYAEAARDTNNELRARFALAERSRAVGAVAEATAEYRRALPIAERLQVQELVWQIHTALGEMAAESGDLAVAERELRAAVGIVRSMTGRITETSLSPNRIRPIDRLMSLLLDAGREVEALETAALAVSLEQVTLLEDARVPRPDPAVNALLRTVRVAATATAAANALATLTTNAPRLAELVAPVRAASIAPKIPVDAAIVFYRLTPHEVVIFVLRREGLAALRTKQEGLREEVLGYAERLAARADLSADHARLQQTLVDPIAPLLTETKRVAFVTTGALGYVALPALGLVNTEEQLVDRFVITKALNVHAAVRGLQTPMPPLAAVPIRAYGAPAAAVNSAAAPLRFAAKELEVIREEHPSTTVVTGDQVTSARLLDGLTTGKGVVHFAGHTFYGNRGQTVFDPLSGRLQTTDGGVSVVDILRAGSDAELIVLSACFGQLRPYERLAGAHAGEELVSFAQALHLAGARHVLSSSTFVDDLATSIVMKRFYRAAKTENAPAALRTAQRAVRALHPHPAWWATFAITTW